MVMLDCCQSVPNMPVDVQALGADWIVASSHKMCGPTGIGFLWGRRAAAPLLHAQPSLRKAPSGRRSIARLPLCPHVGWATLPLPPLSLHCTVPCHCLTEGGAEFVA